jgi:hypothetical protein
MVGPHQGLDATRIGRVGMVDSAALRREDAHTPLLRLRLVDVSEVVVGAVSQLRLGEGGAEVEGQRNYLLYGLRLKRMVPESAGSSRNNSLPFRT